MFRREWKLQLRLHKLTSSRSAGNNLQINAGSLTNIGSLIAAGDSATIAVAGPVVDEAQTLNAYWHSHWVQETGMFHSDKRHDVWACGSPEECTALYGSAYTKTGARLIRRRRSAVSLRR